MNTSIRARHDERGFSFVELLVTIVIAGIAFAAMVPLFVQASQAGQGDKARSIAKNLAQDRIEKIRQLPYNLIDETNLNSTVNTATWKWASPDPQFGLIGYAQSESGISKPFNVTYKVTFVGGKYDGQHRTGTLAGDGSERYLKVAVGVTWAGNPKPTKYVELQTLVFKQSLGPQIIGLETVPGVGVDSLTGELFGVLNPPPTGSRAGSIIQFRAIISPGDANLVQRVAFQIVGPPGVTSPSFALPDGVLNASVTSGTAYETTWTWDSSVVDGPYIIKAVAYSNAAGYNGFPGNTWQRNLSVETGDPLAPASVTVVPGERQMLLTWPASASKDVVAYDIYRADSPAGVKTKVGAFDGQVGAQMPPAWVDWGSDTAGPPTGDLPVSTPYYYWVVARDFLDNPVDPWPASGPTSQSVSAQVSSTTVTLADATAPSMPSSPPLSATVLNQTITIDWAASALDPPSGLPVGGVDNATSGGYLIYRDGDSREPYAATFLVGNVWSDVSLGWGETHTYSVRAFDAALNVSSPSASVTATTATSALAPHYPLTVSTIGPCAVTVSNYASKDFLLPYPKQLSAADGLSYTWSVTPGTYLISARVDAGTPKVHLYTVLSGTEYPTPTGF